MKLDNIKKFHATNRWQWRRWLAKHHPTAPGVWLISYKKDTGKPRVAYDEAVEEALCFGWIDSRPNMLDDERFMQLFTPRKPKSPWSKLNKSRVDKLIAAGLMTKAGLEKIEAAKADGAWTKLDAVENLKTPADLRRALAANKAAQKHFAGFSPSSKKNILWWIQSAKRAETRAQRIAETVRLAATGIKANHYRQ